MAPVEQKETMESMMMKIMGMRSAKSAESEENKMRKLSIIERKLSFQEAEFEENKRIRSEEREEARLIRQEERDERIRADAQCGGQVTAVSFVLILRIADVYHPFQYPILDFTSQTSHFSLQF
jgi:coenzyme F420-reducing hydrogenase beta subunit